VTWANGQHRFGCHAGRRTAQVGRGAIVHTAPAENPSRPTRRRDRRRLLSQASPQATTTRDRGGLGAIPPYEKALNGQEGSRPRARWDDLPAPSHRRYDPGCAAAGPYGTKAYPQTPKGNINDDIEERAGPGVFFVARNSCSPNGHHGGQEPPIDGPFVEAMSHITNFPGGYSPVLSYGRTSYGPTQYQVVEVHDNHPPTTQCKRGPPPGPPAGVCW